MKIFDNWLRKQCHRVLRDTSDDECSTKSGRHGNSIGVGPKNDPIDYMSTYTFKLQPANGGTIIQVSHFDSYNPNNKMSNNTSNSGEWVNDLYIIPDNKEFSEELMSILLQYKLKHC